jgi:hypothetical protein
MVCAALLMAALAATAGMVRVGDDRASPYVPPELVPARPWTLLGYAPPYQVTIDASAIESRDGKVELWLMINFS